MGSAGGGPGSHAFRTAAHGIATAATRPRLIPSGLTLAARIRAAGEGSIRLDRDRLRAYGDLSPISQHRDLLSLRRDGAADGLGITALHLQCAPRLVVPTRLLDRLLHVHAEVDEAHRELEVRLDLRVTSGRAEHEARHRALECDDGVQGMHRPFAWGDSVGRTRIQRETGEAVVEQDPGAWHHGRGTERTEHAFDERYRVAVAIDDREVRRVRGRHERPRLAALGRLRAEGQAAARYEPSVEKPAGIEFDARRVSSMCVTIRERELLCLNHEVNEIRASPLERSDVDVLD